MKQSVGGRTRLTWVRCLTAIMGVLLRTCFFSGVARRSTVFPPLDLDESIIANALAEGLVAGVGLWEAKFGVPLATRKFAESE